MRILVTGGAGFIGSHTVDALVASGAGEVSVLDNFSAGKRHQVNPKATLLSDRSARRRRGDRRRREGAARDDFSSGGADGRAALGRRSGVRRQVNVVGFLNLIESARKHGLKRVVFSSTGGAIYGEQDEFPCTEDHPKRPVSPYGVAKLATEAYLFFYKVEYGHRLRGAALWQRVRPAPGSARRSRRGRDLLRQDARRPAVTIFGDGKQTRDYVYVGDVVRADRCRGEVAKRRESRSTSAPASRPT